MITKNYGINEIIKMFSPAELRIVPIVPKAEECKVPEEYMLYGEPIDKYSLALSALRRTCDEITRRTHNGIVMPRVIVSIDNVDGLIRRCADGEVCDLLDLIETRGEGCGIELIA